VLTLGIDVGVTGAIACLREDGSCVDVIDLPVGYTQVEGGTGKKVRQVDCIALRDIIRKLRGGEQAFAVVEKTQATPTLGVVTAFSMGMQLASVIDGVRLGGCGYGLVAPQSWKRGMGLMDSSKSYSEKKRASLKMARELYPRAPLDYACNDGRAEALLIAHWHQQRDRQWRLEVA
jgi:hypothetical protein